MTKTEQSCHNSARRPGWVSAVALTVVLATLSGCSWVPDYANPVEWYRGTRDWIMGEDEPRMVARRPQPAIPGAKRPFPKISSVPGRPSPPSAAERRLAAGALTADRDRARYTDKIDRRQSAAAAPLAPSTASRGFTPPAVRRGSTPRGASRGFTPPALDRPPPPPAFAPPRMARAPEPLRPSPQSAAPAPPRISATASSTARRPSTAAGKPLQFAFGAPPADIRMSGTPVSSGSPVQAPLGAMAPFPPVGPGAAFADRRSAFGGTKVATILFNSGSSKLSRQGRRLVRSSWQAHRARGGVINVVGHASSRTKNLPPVRHQMANLNVSIDRANVVARELVRLGVRPENIQIDALSNSDPAFFEVMPAGESGNRRVEIHIRR